MEGCKALGWGPGNFGCTLINPTVLLGGGMGTLCIYIYGVSLDLGILTCRPT